MSVDTVLSCSPSFVLNRYCVLGVNLFFLSVVFSMPLKVTSAINGIFGLQCSLTALTVCHRGQQSINFTGAASPRACSGIA
jgi:hypothetical protein